MELAEYPEDWHNRSAVQYALLLLDANPPRRLAEATSPQRRREDHAV